MRPEPSSPGQSLSDLALLRAARVWVGVESSALWDVFRHDRRAELAWAWDEQPPEDRRSAFSRLQEEHAAQARPDLSRVHPSLRLRALKEEACVSVRLAVVAALPEALREPLYAGLHIEPDHLSPSREFGPRRDPRAVMALWTERLVGDIPERPGEPRVIAALTRFDAGSTARLIHIAGLAKWSLTDVKPPEMKPKDRERYVLFRAAMGAADSRFHEVAYRDVESIDKESPRPEAALGMITFARLLNAADPHRVRWALQHLPYPTAKSLRLLMGPTARKAPNLARWESDILRAAWDVLQVEGRISIRWEDVKPDDLDADLHVGVSPDAPGSSPRRRAAPPCLASGGPVRRSVGPSGGAIRN